MPNAIFAQRVKTNEATINTELINAQGKAQEMVVTIILL
jgi:hypothetical protein